MKIIYHSADLDGICSAAIVLGAVQDIEAGIVPILLPMDYGWQPPAIESLPQDSRVYLVDFSFPPDYMALLAARVACSKSTQGLIETLRRLGMCLRRISSLRSSGSQHP